MENSLHSQILELLYSFSLIYTLRAIFLRVQERGKEFSWPMFHSLVAELLAFKKTNDCQRKKSFKQSIAHSFASRSKSTHGIAHGEVLATLGTTGSQYAATVLGSHTSAETMLVQTAMVVRLESHLHSSEILYSLLLFCRIAGAKVAYFSQTAKYFRKKLYFFLPISRFFATFAPRM